LSFLDGIWNALLHLLAPYSKIPESTLLIVLVALGLSLATNLANRLLVDINKVKTSRQEIAEWKKGFEKARQSGDKKQMEKAMKRQAVITKLQGRMALEQMKVSAIFFIPFLAIFTLLSQFFGSTIVAYSPFRLPFLIDHQLQFVTWYILSSFATSLPIAKILKTSPE